MSDFWILTIILLSLAGVLLLIQMVKGMGFPKSSKMSSWRTRMANADGDSDLDVISEEAGWGSTNNSDDTFDDVVW